MLKAKKIKHCYASSAEQRIDDYLKVLKRFNYKKIEYKNIPPSKDSLQERSYHILSRISETRKKIIKKIDKLVTVYRKNTSDACCIRYNSLYNKPQQSPFKNNQDSPQANISCSKIKTRKLSVQYFKQKSKKSINQNSLSKEFADVNAFTLEPWGNDSVQRDI